MEGGELPEKGQSDQVRQCPGKERAMGSWSPIPCSAAQRSVLRSNLLPVPPAGPLSSEAISVKTPEPSSSCTFSGFVIIIVINCHQTMVCGIMCMITCVE